MAKAAIKPTVNPWDQFTNEQVADMLGALSASMASMDARRKELVQELLARGAGPQVHGNAFRAIHVGASTQAYYKKELLEEVFPEIELRRCMKYKTVSETYRTNPIAQNLADLAVQALTAGK